MNNICKNALFHFRNIRTVRDCLTDSAAAQLVHSLVTSRLDYCNSLLYGLPDSKLNKLQRVQNVACRIVCRVPKTVHITTFLEQQHWLPIKLRIVFKILLLTFKVFNGLAPDYLLELVQPKRKTRWSLRRDQRLELQMPASRLKTYGDRSFAYAAAKEWNNIPFNIRSADSVEHFKPLVKTFLFNKK